MMRLIDSKFRSHRAAYVKQSALAVVAMFLVLSVLDALTNAAVVAALGASCFIAFTMPHAQVSRPRYMLGGYAVGMAAGALCHFAAAQASLAGIPYLSESGTAIFGALALGLAIFMMVVLNFEHPPAASLALGFVLNGYSLHVIVVVALGIVLVLVVRALLKPMLIDLL